MTSRQRKLYAVLRQDLAAFIAKIFQTVCPGETYHEGWYINCLAWHLEQCFKRRYRRLIICLPPRSLKSISASVAFPAWALGQDPTLKFICVSYAHTLSETFSRQTQAVLQSFWYRLLFPKTRLNPRKTSATEMETTKKGFRLATSIGGTLTGRGGNFIIIDDPIKIDEAMSQAELQKVNDWFDTVCRSRLNNKKNDVIIIVTQRAHVNDLVAHVTEKEEWQVVNIPAIPDEDQQYQIGEDDYYDRPAGELLCPKREDHETLRQLEMTMGSYAFHAQYQQCPMPPEGNLVKRRWFNTYDCPPDRDNFDQMVQSWDTASSGNELASYSVCTTWGTIGRNYYLIDVFRERLEYPDLRRKVIAQDLKYKPDLVLIESAGSGRSLIQDLGRGGPPAIRPIRPVNDKVTRLAAVSAKIEAGQVFLPESAPWLNDFLREVLAFPNSAHDDQVDSFSQALRFLGRFDFWPREQVRPNPPPLDESLLQRRSGKEPRRHGSGHNRRSKRQPLSGLHYRTGFV